MPADFLLAGAIILVLDGFWLGRHLDPPTIGWLAAGVVLFHLACFSYADRDSPRWRWVALKIAAANLLAWWILPYTFPRLGINLDHRSCLGVLAVLTPLQLLLRSAHRRFRAEAPLEPLRWTLLVGSGVLASFPFLTTKPVGSGDAYWYGNMVGDFVTQWRAGVFPVFVGQSDYAFNGAVSPLRLAPYLQHAAGIFDLLTFHTLPSAGLLNLTLAFSIIAGGFTTYGCLVSMDRGPRWLAFLFALLFLTCPGVLALAYTNDLFMSVCSLPYVPLALYGIWRVFRQADTKAVCFLATALAATWLCHPPIAFWAMVVATLSVVVLCIGGSAGGRPTIRGLLAGAALFTVLTLGALVATLTLKLPAMVAERIFIIQYLTEAFPGAILPISDGATALSDYQLGWSLWAVLLIAGAVTLAKPRGVRVAWLLGIALILLFLLPIPHVMKPLWEAMPQFICNITFHWPMQRFYVLLGALAVFLGYDVAADLAGRRAWLGALVAVGLGFGLTWSVQEAVFFTERGSAITATDAQARLMEAPQNRILTRYSYNPFPVAPSYFSHGYVDPLWEMRLLARDSLRESSSNYQALSGALVPIRAEGALTGSQQGESNSYVLLTGLPIEPGHHYALEFTINPPGLVGSLIISGPTVAREYYLPDSGIGVPRQNAPTAFGTLPSAKHSVPLLSQAPATEKLSVQFISNAPVNRDLTDFGHYTLREYDPAQLPVAVDSWTPYRARVTTPAPGWVETTQIFVEGYRATVNGRPTSVARSPDGLVMIPVDAGDSRVTLNYPGPITLRIAYYLSLAAWGVVIFGGLRCLVRRPRPVAPA